jgi:hypothetical protein
LSGNLFRPVQQGTSDSGAAVPIVNNECDEAGEGLVSVDERNETERSEPGHGVIDLSDEQVPFGICSPLVDSLGDLVR